MDIVRFKGGLGNQMFQYALVEALRSRGRNVGCSLGFYRNHPDLMPFMLDKIFKNTKLNEVGDTIFNQIDEKWKNIKERPNDLAEIVSNPKNRFFYVEDSAHTYYEDVFQTDNCVFVGYWQSEKYFKDIRNTILNAFLFPVKELALNNLGKILATENYISVHVRRGDYLEFDKGINVCKYSYYSEAINYIKELIPDVKFVFFSDDIKWVKETFTLKDVLICNESLFKNYKDWYDMYLMTQCRGNIIANSTFSWWGAWLNQGKEQIVIAPKIWRYGRDTPDIWCENWIRI